MKKSLSLFLTVLAIAFAGLLGAKTPYTQTPLSAIAFANKIKTLPNAPVIDVRTPGEFMNGHLQNAKNVNWNSSDFEQQISVFDKSKPVFIYCLSGGRSSAAVAKMQSLGFSEVIELSGGIMKWRAAGLPETTANVTPPSKGMTLQQFQKLLVSDKIVLVDFYADWCFPCKQMKPHLDEIAKEMADKVVVIRINADENPELLQELKIDALPSLQIHKKNRLVWSNTGYINKAGIVKQLR